MTALGKTRRAFDVTTPAQAAALASLDVREEIASRRRPVNAEGRAELDAASSGRATTVDGAVGNFLYVDLGEARSRSSTRCSARA